MHLSVMKKSLSRKRLLREIWITTRVYSKVRKRAIVSGIKGKHSDLCKAKSEFIHVMYILEYKIVQMY